MNGQQPQAGAAAPPEKKSKKGCILAGCGGCLFIVLCTCICSGYLMYLEEGVSYSHPGDEVTSQPYVPGTPTALEVTFDGTGYAHHRVYLDVGAAAPSGLNVTGDFGCSDYGQVRPRPVRESYYGNYGDTPSGWIKIENEYVRSPGTLRCAGTLMTDQPVVGARLVVTRRQRPSDWLSGVF
jgi:hypothetical protein